MIKAYFDGAITRNPGGIASYGCLIEKNGKELQKWGDCIGEGEGMSSNLAEWHGLKCLLRELITLKFRKQRIEIFGDSKLVINCINGIWKVKSENLIEIFLETYSLLQKLKSKHDVQIKWVRRELNKADMVSR
jgi:ribonuclease HI